jgi:hypothetical protein
VKIKYSVRKDYVLMIAPSSGIAVFWERGNCYVEQCRVVKVRIIHFLVTHKIWMLKEHGGLRCLIGISMKRVTLLLY